MGKSEAFPEGSSRTMLDSQLGMGLLNPDDTPLSLFTVGEH